MDSTLMKKINSLLREPLVHFLLIGAGLFLLYDLTNGPAGGKANQIVVTPGQVEQMEARFSRTWMRPPTNEELTGLIDSYVRDEVYYREAVAMGLAVFGLHAALDQKPETAVDNPYLVEVSSADIEWMRTLFTKRMGRGPTVQDLRGQVNQLIREQILSREAVAMGLDEGDMVVCRRLAQKSV